MRPFTSDGVDICLLFFPSASSGLVCAASLHVPARIGDGESGNDALVVALKQRRAGSVRYTRYIKAPAPPDPKYRDMLNHASLRPSCLLWIWLAMAIAPTEEIGGEVGSELEKMETDAGQDEESWGRRKGSKRSRMRMMRWRRQERVRAGGRAAGRHEAEREA